MQYQIQFVNQYGTNTVLKANVLLSANVNLCCQPGGRLVVVLHVFLCHYVFLCTLTPRPSDPSQRPEDIETPERWCFLTPGFYPSSSLAGTTVAGVDMHCIISR